jgi:hypothetical protein
LEFGHSPGSNSGGSSTGGFDFEWWFILFGYSIMIVYPFNTIIGLLLSLKPKWVINQTLAPFLWIFYIAEVLTIPYFVYLAVERINDAFFPEEPDFYLSDILIGIFGEKEISIYEKLDAINMGILGLCGVLFIIFFWKYYSMRKRQNYL